MDSMTTARNYRGFTVTNPGRGNWNFEMNGHGNSAKTYKEAMAKIDRWFEEYDKAVAYLAQNAEPIASHNIKRYRDLKTEFTRAQDKVASSSGMQSASLSLWAGETLQDELAKAEAMLEYRKECIAEVERIISLIRELPTDIAEQDRELSHFEFKYSHAKHYATVNAWLGKVYA